MTAVWVSRAAKGRPVFVQDGTVLTIIGEAGDRGLWTADTAVTPGKGYVFFGERSGSGHSAVRVIWRTADGVAIASVLPEDGDLLTAPAGAAAARINCVLSGAGTAVFREIRLTPQCEIPIPQPGLPIPPPDLAQKHHVSGWKWGPNIAVVVHHQDEVPAIEPPDYGIPYAVTGFQHGRRLDLEIGNMAVTDEEEE